MNTNEENLKKKFSIQRSHTLQTIQANSSGYEDGLSGSTFNNSGPNCKCSFCQKVYKGSFAKGQQDAVDRD